MPLIKLAQIHRTEPLIFVERINLNNVVVDPDSPIRISDGDIQSEVVMEVVIVRRGEIELRERGVGGVELEEIWTEDEPQEKDDNAEEDDEGDDDLTDEVEDTSAAAVAEASETAAAAAAAVATARAVVGLGGGRRN